jgi:hypothetical protein
LSFFSSVNIFKVKLVVSFCYLSVISDICEPCLGCGGRGVSISRIPWIGYIGIRDICRFIFRDMGYVSSELLGHGILHCHFGYF